MPQVAARISDDQERRLKDYFRTKSAGAEFILPWASELKTIVDAHKDVRLLPENTGRSYLVLRISDACDMNGVHLRHGASKSSLESKLNTLDDTQSTALMVWASAFWVSKNCSAESLDDYIKGY